MNEALKTLLVNARTASRSLNRATREEIDRTLRHVADAAEANMEKILAANADDLAKMDPADPKYDRLRLTPERLKGIADDMRKVATVRRILALSEKRQRLCAERRYGCRLLQSGHYGSHSFRIA